VVISLPTVLSFTMHRSYRLCCVVKQNIEIPRRPGHLHRFHQLPGSTSISIAFMSLLNRSSRLTSMRLCRNWCPGQARCPQPDSSGIYLFGGICKNTLNLLTIHIQHPFFTTATFWPPQFFTASSCCCFASFRCLCPME